MSRTRGCYLCRRTYLSYFSPFPMHQAVVIISILLQFLNKIDRQDLKPSVWKGAFAGMFGAIAIGIAFIIAFYEAGEQFFTGRTEYIVEAILVSFPSSSVVVVDAARTFRFPRHRERLVRRVTVSSNVPSMKIEQYGLLGLKCFFAFRTEESIVYTP